MQHGGQLPLRRPAWQVGDLKRLEQQQIVDYLITENQILKENLSG